MPGDGCGVRPSGAGEMAPCSHCREQAQSVAGSHWVMMGDPVWKVSAGRANSCHMSPLHRITCPPVTSEPR